MSSTDRNQKLKNYHARKVRERQLQQQQKQQKQKENVENPSSAVLPSVLNIQPQVSIGVGGGPMKNNEGHHSFKPAATTATATSIKSKSRSSRSLFATGTIKTTAGGAIVPKETKEGHPSSLAGGRNPKGRIISMRTTTPSSSSSSVASVASSHHGGETTMGSGGGGSDKLNNGESLSVTSLRMSTTSSSIAAPPKSTTITTAPPPTTTMKKLNKFAPSSTNNKLNSNPSRTTPRGESSNNNINSSSSENSTASSSTNNAAAAAKMFAARRRRAQLEMTSGDSSSVASVGNVVVVVGGGSGGVNGGGGVAVANASLNVDTKSTTAPLNVDTKSTTASLNADTKSTTSSSTRDTFDKRDLVGRGIESANSIRSGGSIESVKSSSNSGGGSSTSFKNGSGGGNGGRISSSLATRKAYDRYSGSNNNSSSGSSGGSVTSLNSGNSHHHHHHRGSSSNDHSGRGRSRPSSAPVTTTTTSSSIVSRRAMNGINSMDSTDNSTIASAPSMDYGDRLSSTSLSSNIVGRTIKVGDDDTAKRVGLESIREVSGTSFSSVSTIQVSNCQQKSEEVESNDGKGGSSGDDAAAAGDNKSAPMPILRQPHLHEIRVATNDEDDGQSKSVRFDLSPLERQRKVDAGVASKKVVGRVAQHDMRPSANAVQSVYRGDEAPSSIQKSSPSSMDDSNAYNSTPRISDEASQNMDAPADEEEYDEEFATFINGLRREVAGDHTKLWSEFQSIMGRASDEHIPLNQPSHNGKTDADPRKKKKKEKIQFDPQTTKTLNAIYKHFHEENQRVNSSSRRFLRKKSQLRNDKDIVKQQREEKRMAAEAAAGRGEAAMVEHSKDGRMDVKSPVRRPLEKGRGKSGSNSHPKQSNHSNKSSSGKNELAAIKLRPAPSRSSAKDEPANLSTPKNELSSVKLRPSPPPANTTKTYTKLTPQKSFAVGVSNKMSRVLQRSNSKSSNGSGRSNSSRDEKEKKSTNWMDSLKMKQKLSRMKQTSESNNASLQVETGGSLDTSGIEKNVSPRKKLRISPPSSPEEREGQVPPWAKVQLRNTQRRGELLSDTPTGSVCHSTPKSFSPMATSQSTKGTTSDSLPPLCCVGDTIDLESLPKGLFPEEAATVFPLKKKNADDGSQQFVIVGTIAIVTVSGTAGSEGHNFKISWWCRRSTIRTLTLNVEATGATLAHASGRMPLVFESSDICLDFAQAFYRGPSKPVPQASSPPKQPPAQEEATQESTKMEDSEKEGSSYQIGDGNIKAVLTEAEESLLAELRQYDETEKPKLRLICLSPKGEEVVEVTVSDRNNLDNDGTDEQTMEKKGGSGLTKEEEKSVSSYKKMLAVGLPPDVVRHKMTLEGVQASVVAAVLGADESTKNAQVQTKKEGDVADPRNVLLNAIEKKGNEGDDSKGDAADPRNALLNAIKKKGNEGDDSKGEAADPRNALLNAIKKKGNEVEDSSNSLPTDPKNALFAAIKGKGAEPPKSKLSDEEDIIASKYRRMLKMGIPLDAVQHSMKKEGLDPKIASVVAEEASPHAAGKGAEPSKSKLSDEEDRIASKYRRMLKMGIPLDAVKHSMKKEGVDPKIVSVVAEEASPNEAVIAPVTPAKPMSKSGSTGGPVLSEEEEKIASKYRKMLKLCIPKDAVRHDMKKEGVSQKIVDAIFGKDNAVNNGNNMATPAKGKNTKTKGIHWTANNLRQDLLEGSIFARSATKKRKLPLIYPEEADIKKLEELFRKNDNVHTGKVKSAETNAGNEMAKLLDITRANNIAIQLKAFNDFTLRALAETINDLDPDSKIVGERVQFIPQLLPTPKELQAIKNYKGDSDRLNTAELFFQQLLPVKRAEDKVAVVKAMCTFSEHAEEARAGFKTLEEVCGQVMNSSKLEQILLMVLNIGNLMNEGSLDGGVEAFKFESLPKLSQTKSADGKTTVLDYIVETFIEKGARETLFLNSDFPDIQESCRLSINDLCGEVNTLRKNYQLCKTEHNSMKKDQTPKPAKGTQKKKIEAEATDPRKALFAAIQSRGTNDDGSSPEPAPVDPRQALFAALKNKGADASTTNTPGANVKYSRGVKRLESFIWKAEASLSLTERDQSAALRACKGLAVYCGEEGGERSASVLLQILSAFASSLKAAVEKYDKRVELSKRQKTPTKRVPQKNDKENQVNALPERKQLLKASSLQPHVGLTDRVKRVGAGVDSNTSSLATIAKPRHSPKPKTRHKQTSSSNDGDARSAMFAAIKSRNQEPLGVANKVRTVDTNVQQRESRIHMVHKMLKEAPSNVKDDFLRGVTYRETSDPLLQKIYQEEGDGDDNTPDELKPVDPRQELFSAIKSRRQE